MKTINSKRRFIVTGLSEGKQMPFISYSLNDFLNPKNDYELVYSMQDNLDAILNLDLYKALTMYCNRDNKTDSNLIIVYRNQ